jgi:hypothetical protein
MLTAPANRLTAVAVGSTDGGPITEATDFVVTAFVRKKFSAAEMEIANIQPFRNVYLNTVERRRAEPYDLDVIESGSDFEPLVGLVVPKLERGKYGGNPPTLNTQKWFSKLKVGIGITNPTAAYPQTLSVGTVGFYVTDDHGQKYLVSNNHVIGRSNRARVNESVVHPGTLDLTGIELSMMPTITTLTDETEVATFSGLVEIEFMDQNNIPKNRVDAAAAELTVKSSAMSELSRTAYGGSISGVADPYDLDPNTGEIMGSSQVYKVGRTTGYTEGTVTNVAATVTLDYEGGSAYFVDQIVVKPTVDNVGPFSAGGDSGSGVLNHRHELVGLLFAGSREQTLVNPIDQVLDGLKNALPSVTALDVITA